MSNYCYCAAGGKTKYPFHEAAFAGDIKKLEELFKIEDLETKDCGGNTPLLIAVKAQQVEAIVYCFDFIYLEISSVKRCKSTSRRFSRLVK